eukprot:2679635-Pyramimonas_sp.AAC.1
MPVEGTRRVPRGLRARAVKADALTARAWVFLEALRGPMGALSGAHLGARSEPPEACKGPHEGSEGAPSSCCQRRRVDSAGLGPSWGSQGPSRGPLGAHPGALSEPSEARRRPQEGSERAPSSRCHSRRVDSESLGRSWGSQGPSRGSSWGPFRAFRGL